MPKGNRLKAITTGKCPKCQEGNIFQYKWWQLQNFTKMNKICTVCGVNFEVEPGFFLWSNVYELCIYCSYNGYWWCVYLQYV